MVQCPSIPTARLLLRALDLSDAPRIAELAGDREIASTTLLIPHPYTLADAERWLSAQQAQTASPDHLNWGVCLREGPLIGAIGLVLKREHDRAEMGYWIGKEWWGHGYATEAARAVVGFAFERLRLNRVCAYHYARNPASGRVLEKVGMLPEGVQRGHIKKWGAYEDCVQYGVLKSDWAARPG
jgi:[ribosomal protein S5]-alanine N-acetyltransferase